MKGVRATAVDDKQCFNLRRFAGPGAVVKHFSLWTAAPSCSVPMIGGIGLWMVGDVPLKLV